MRRHRHAAAAEDGSRHRLRIHDPVEHNQPPRMQPCQQASEMVHQRCGAGQITPEEASHAGALFQVVTSQGPTQRRKHQLAKGVVLVAPADEILQGRRFCGENSCRGRRRPAERKRRLLREQRIAEPHAVAARRVGVRAVGIGPQRALGQPAPADHLRRRNPGQSNPPGGKQSKRPIQTQTVDPRRGVEEQHRSSLRPGGELGELPLQASHLVPQAAPFPFVFGPQTQILPAHASPTSPAAASAGTAVRCRTPA